MIYFLLGLYCIVPSVFSTANISEPADEVVVESSLRRCGPGNEAKNFDDLGENTEIDRCCRSHDHCPLSIAPGETKHNFTNNGLYTISECVCDTALRQCLHNTNLWVADLVRGLFAFTNNRCLINVCAYPGYRCPRGVDVELDTLGFVFRGIAIINNTDTLNQLILTGIANEKEKESSKSVNNERSLAPYTQHPVPYHRQWQRQKENAYPSFGHHWQLQHVDQPAQRYDQSIHFNYQNLPTQQQPHIQHVDQPAQPYDQSIHFNYQNLPTQQQPHIQHVDQPAQPYDQSIHFNYQNLPTQQQPDTFCCVDDLQQL